MNTDTGEVRELKPGEKLPDGNWIRLLEDEAEMAQLYGPKGLKAMTPDPHFDKRQFRQKYGCSRFEYALRRAK